MKVRINGDFVLSWWHRRSNTFKVPSPTSHWLSVKFMPWSTSIAFVNKDEVISKRLARVATFPFKRTVCCAFNCRCPKSLQAPFPATSIPLSEPNAYRSSLYYDGSSLKQETSLRFIWMVPSACFQTARNTLQLLHYQTREKKNPTVNENSLNWW